MSLYRDLFKDLRDAAQLPEWVDRLDRSPQHARCGEFDAYLKEGVARFHYYKYSLFDETFVCMNARERAQHSGVLQELAEAQSSEELHHLLGKLFHQALLPFPSKFVVDAYGITSVDFAIFMYLHDRVPTASLAALHPQAADWVAFAKYAFDRVSQAASRPSCSSKIAPSDDTNFIREIVKEDLRTEKHKEIVTRFPPEPNGFLHLGHAKSICINFGLARDFGGRCHLRFDDTNPEKEEKRYIDAIQEDIAWLGGDWGDHLYHASDYFDQLHAWAKQLIRQGDAYVDHQSMEELRRTRGDLLHPGTNSPFRDQSVDENLQQFEDMTAGKYNEGACVLRAKIDMAHGNPLMRDPLLYRIKCDPHPRTKTRWRVYPTYDFAHGQSDSIEKITHSICTLEFEDHRPLYDWFQQKLGIFRTRQIEFARLNCTYVVMSKRRLCELVDNNVVSGWDDPRLPTLAGLRAKGVPPKALMNFCERIGVAKRSALIDYDLLNRCLMQVVHPVALRAHVVLRPLRVIVTNLDSETVIPLEFPCETSLARPTTRTIHFSRILYIDQADFRIEATPDYHRLAPNTEVRLKYGFWVRCHEYKLNEATGEVEEVLCTYDPSTRGGNPPSADRKVKGTIHWVSEVDALDFEVKMYDHLFTRPSLDDIPKDKSWRDYLNPNSEIVYRAKGETFLKHNKHPYNGGVYCQFERIGYFVADCKSTEAAPSYALLVRLYDSWAAKTDASSSLAQKKEAEKLARQKAAEKRELKKLNREKKTDRHDKS